MCYISIMGTTPSAPVVVAPAVEPTVELPSDDSSEDESDDEKKYELRAEYEWCQTIHDLTNYMTDTMRIVAHVMIVCMGVKLVEYLRGGRL